MYDWDRVNLRIRGEILREFGINVWRSFSGKRCTGFAAELSFWFFYSLFPFLTFLVAVSSFLPFAENPDKVLATANRLLPFSVESVVGPIVENILAQRSYWLVATALLLALWSASRGVSSLMAALNQVYEVEETRSFIKTKGIALLLVVTITAIYMLAFSFLVAGPVAIKYFTSHLGMANSYWILSRTFRLGTAVVALFLAFMVIYGIVPDTRHEAALTIPGAVVASTGWIAASWGFGYYVSNFADFDRFYGTLGAVIIMLTWLFLVGLLILVGAVVNKELMRVNENGRN